jgi:hypothetical protein
MRWALSVGWVVASSVFLPMSASAVTVSYDNRADFEAALTSFHTDDFTGIESGLQTFADRGGYSISSQAMFGCVNVPAECGPPPAGGDGIGLFHYVGEDTFRFDTAINGFGFDFGQTLPGATTVPIIDGISATRLGGFFGIISDVAKTTFTLNQNQQFLITDNLTYGVVAPVPLPAGLFLSLSALGALGLFGARRKRMADTSA